MSTRSSPKSRTLLGLGSRPGSASSGSRGSRPGSARHRSRPGSPVGNPVAMELEEERQRCTDLEYEVARLTRDAARREKEHAEQRETELLIRREATDRAWQLECELARLEAKIPGEQRKQARGGATPVPAAPKPSRSFRKAKRTSKADRAMQMANERLQMEEDAATRI